MSFARQSGKHSQGFAVVGGYSFSAPDPPIFILQML